MRKQRTYLSMIACIAICAFFFHARVWASTPADDYNDYIYNIAWSLNNKDIDRDKWLFDVVNNFCTAVSWNSSFSNDEYVYNAQYSVFVHILCKKTDNNFTTLQKYISEDENKIDYCSSLDTDCDLASKLPELFNMIITDYVNMKQANIYGLVWNPSSEDDMEKQANIFSLANFNIKLCDNEIRSYDATCRTMKSYLKNARNLLSDVRIFDTKELLDAVKPIVEIHAKEVREIPYSITVKPWKNLSTCSSKTSTDYNILLCWLYGDTTSSMDSFINLVYNELFFYRLFMWDYLLSIQKYPKDISKNTYATVSKKFSSEYNRSKEALSLSLRMMRDMYMAYPLHIGFLMYQEDLNGFGKLLAKITTPIYTLYDKLRNVQKPE